MPSIDNDVTAIVKNDIKTNSARYSSDSQTVSDNKFQIKTKSFPSNLSQQENKQFILFQINVRGKSKLRAGENKISVVTRDPTGSSLTESQLATAKTGTAIVAGALAGLGAASLLPRGKAPETGVQKSIQAAKQVVTKVGLAVAGGIVGGLVTNLEENLQPDTTYRIDSTVSLFIQDPPSVKYSAQYSNKDLGTLTGLIGGSSATDSLVGLATEGGAALLTAFAKVPQQLGMGSPADLIGASAKVGLNPFKEVLFEAIDFRSFSFKYRFMPKSRQEADSVQNIIETFKYHMHPSLSDNKLFFIYPSEFEISYINESGLHPYFHKFKPCVLESLDVTYGGDQYTTFYDARPTEINLSMIFRETEILTKSEIEKGY